MAGIYIHIPFCKQACNYCNFHFSTSLKNKEDVIAALLREITLQKDYLSGEKIDTIYFGGGTPSLLSGKELEIILEKISRVFIITAGAEITLEANPDDIDILKLKEWKASGINRLSIGAQSFFEEDLQWMNRAHNSEQAVKSILNAQQEGFSNITIDLIYGGPTLDDFKWQKNVEQAIALNIPHLSCYALTVEPRTALNKMIEQKKLPAIDADVQAKQFLLLMKWMEAAGYEHYEISNFAKPRKRSRHNSSYWQGKKYLGLGPSAHSYNGSSRQWNIANNVLYAQSLAKDILSFELEELKPVQQLNEYIMISLRTMEGIDLNYVTEKFGTGACDLLLREAAPHLKSSTIKNINSSLILTTEGKLLADGIAAALFFEKI